MYYMKNFRLFARGFTLIFPLLANTSNTTKLNRKLYIFRKMANKLFITVGLAHVGTLALLTIVMILTN